MRRAGVVDVLPSVAHRRVRVQRPLVRLRRAPRARAVRARLQRHDRRRAVDARDAARGRRDDRARERRPRQHSSSFDASARVRAHRDVGARRRFDARVRARSARASVARRSARATRSARRDRRATRRVRAVATRVAPVGARARENAVYKTPHFRHYLPNTEYTLLLLCRTRGRWRASARGRRNVFRVIRRRRDARGRRATGDDATRGARRAAKRGDRWIRRAGGRSARARTDARTMASDRSNARARARASDGARGASRTRRTRDGGVMRRYELLRSLGWLKRWIDSSTPAKTVARRARGVAARARRAVR